ncbi:MAG: D-alanine--D-alanine ligase family protein [Actinomycetota bacterium]
MASTDLMGDRRIAVVSGFVSEEDALYLREGDASSSSLSAILASLARSGLRAAHLDPTRGDFVAAVRDVDVVFLNVHGPYGEDSRIQGLLDYLSIPYVNSGVCASAVGMDKLVTKAVFNYLDIPTPQATPVIDRSRIEALADTIEVPCMLKATKGGSSVGIELIEEREALGAAEERIRERGFERLFVEDFIDCRSLTVGVLEWQGAPLALPALETVTERPFYDELAKLNGGDESQTWYREPVDVSEAAMKAMRVHSERIYEFLACRGAVRVDFMVDADNRVFALEINTAPGLQPHSNLPMAAALRGIGYDDLILALLDQAFYRGNRVPWAASR